MREEEAREEEAWQGLENIALILTMKMPHLRP
jgi:hypothetical protein